MSLISCECLELDAIACQIERAGGSVGVGCPCLCHSFDVDAANKIIDLMDALQDSVKAPASDSAMRKQP